MAAAADLTTLAEVKAWLGINATGDDALLARLITSASLYFAKRVGRLGKLYSRGYSERRDGTRTTRMMLKNYPVSQITALTINKVAISASTDGVAAGYMLADDQRTLCLIGFAFDAGFQNVFCTYLAGYTPGGDDLSNIEQAVIDLIGRKYTERQHIGQTAKSVGGNETVAFSSKDESEYVKNLIAAYTDVVPI